MAKLINCKHCNHEIARSAKTCPNCGGKNRQTSILTKMLLVLFFFGVMGSIINSNKSTLSPQASSTSKPSKPSKTFENLFYVKFDTKSVKGVTKVQGFFTEETNADELKRHCKDQYRGFTACFYYKTKPNIVHISAMKPFDALGEATKTPYFARVDVSVDGRKIDYSKKK